MSMVVPYFSVEGQQTTVRKDESLLDQWLSQRGKKIPSPAERLQDVLRLFEESTPTPELAEELWQKPPMA